MYKRQPMTHQLTMIEYAIEHGILPFYCEAGTGKTQPVVNAFTSLKKYNRVKHCLIICPKSVIETGWVGEITKNSDHTYTVVEGTKKKKLKLLFDTDTDFYIINYEAVLSFEDKKTKKMLGDWNKFDMVILDESQRINNYITAKTSRLIVKLFSKRDIVKGILSGTPIDKNPLGFWAQFEFLDPTIFNIGSWYAFRNRYAVIEDAYGSHGVYKKIVRFQNMDELKSIIAANTIQYKKSECLDLPPKVYTTRMLEMSTELSRQYNEMKKELVLFFSETEFISAANALVKIIRLQQIISGSYVELKDNNKLKEVIEIIENSDESIIIWCRFIESINMLMANIKEPVSLLYGATKDRAEQIELFQNKTNRIFIGQIQTGGLGITLTAGTHVIYYENTFKLGDRLQSEDRAHRKGQDNKVLYTDLIYKDTIDINIINSIRTKQDIADSVLDCFTGTKVNYKRDVKK